MRYLVVRSRDTSTVPTPGSEASSLCLSDAALSSCVMLCDASPLAAPSVTLNEPVTTLPRRTSATDVDTDVPLSAP